MFCFSSQSTNISLTTKIQLPDELKSLLELEERAITVQFKIHAIPLKNSIDEIMTKYLKHVRTQNNGTIDGNVLNEINQMVDGIIEYFNCYLGSCLLYEREKMQYSEMLCKFRGVKMSYIYGSFHLLRLFTKIIPLSRKSELPKIERETYFKHINDLLLYLADNSDALFRRVPFLPNTYYTIN